MDALSTMTLVLAVVTFLLAVAAFWSVWQNYKFRKEDRLRETKERSANELCLWVDEALRLFYLPYNTNKEEIYIGLIKILNIVPAATAASIILGNEFLGLIKRANNALVNYFGEIKEKRKGNNRPINESIINEFDISFSGLQLYLNLLRTWDYNYKLFIKDASENSPLPLSENLELHVKNQ